jgi:predicted dehydrogenase
MKLRVGLIGLGDNWQKRHAPALRALADRFEVKAVCDQVGHRAEQAAGEFGAVAVDGYRVLAARENLDAVLILSPQWFGALPILAACESGKAVYCAAGLELQPEEAERVRQHVQEAGITFMTEFPRRVAPTTLRLKELIATRLGFPRLLFCRERLGAFNGHGLPAAAPQEEIVREMIELVDWCCFIIGREPTAVVGVVHRNAATKRDDYQMMSLDFSDRGKPGTGPIAQISCGSYVPAKWHEAIGYRPQAALEASCERGVAFVDLPASLVWFDEAGRHQESLDSERPVGEQLLSQFHFAVTNRARRVCDLDAAYHAIRMVQQARTSHHEGRRVDL